MVEKSGVSAKLPAVGRLLQIAGRESEEASERWRIERARYFAQCAQDTLERKKSTAEVCENWSHFADRLLTAAFERTLELCPLTAKLALFAYGKLGARELNLSSDVDLVLVSSEEDPKLSEWIRQFRKLLQDSTEYGFCFRLDFDLRPGGRMGPLVPTVAQFEDYFSNYGEAWERLAFVRFRAVCGDPQVSSHCVRHSQAFTYRKHLDFTLMEDLKVLRQRIHEQNWRRSEGGALDLKLGLGGIRDLELFVHTQQVIHGGRDPGLRVNRTEEALRLLGERKILTEPDCEFLIEHYWKLRHYENLLQAATDQQIQVLPAQDWLDLIPAGERADLREKMRRCQDLVSDLLGPVDLKIHSLPELENEQREWLLSLGYSTAVCEEVWPRLIQKSVLSRQPERDELYRKRFLSEIIEKLASKSRNRDLSLRILEEFLNAIRAKAAFFHLLLQKKELLERLVLLFSSSTYLSRILIQRPELLDSFLYQSHEPRRDQDWDLFLASCLEKKLLTEMTAGLDFLHDRNLPVLLSRLSQVADEIVENLLEKLGAEYTSTLKVIAMGKWGGREIGLRSDLDLVFVTESAPTEDDFRVARRFISRLTEVQKGGALYQLDFRLKPHGKGGPLLTSKSDLIEYLKKESNPWERQAYLKAREIGGSGETQIHQACFEHPLRASDWEEFEKIHLALLQKAKSAADIKYAPGGLVETEFVVQLVRLKSGRRPVSTSTLDELADFTHSNPVWKSIRDNYVQLRTWEQTLHLIATRPQFSFVETSEEVQMLSSLLNTNPSELLRRIQLLLQQNAALLGPLDPRPGRG
jgi:glutamate-ammonia-ligase adenylyltransferase